MNSSSAFMGSEGSVTGSAWTAGASTVATSSIATAGVDSAGASPPWLMARTMVEMRRPMERTERPPSILLRLSLLASGVS